MPEQKPFKLGSLQQDLPRSGSAEGKNGLDKPADDKGRPRVVDHKPFRPGLAMHSDMQTRKARGRLSRETMNKLGKVLEAYFDDARNQPVPDRLRDLLQQVDDRLDPDQGSELPKGQDEDKGSGG
jgi:anti-sigma factor NepR-like protein